jgi:hypothetical protein
MVCRKSPYFDKPLPPHLDQNDIAREQIETARKANAKKEGIEYKPLPRASESDVARWRESEHASGKTTGMLANSVQKRVNADFTAGLVEFDDPTFMNKVPAGMALSDFALDEYEPECLCGECFGADVAAVATTSPVPSASGPAAATPYSRTPLPSISAEALPELQAQLAARGDGKTVEIPVHMGGGGAASTPSPLALTTRLDDAAAPTTGGPPPTPLPTVPEGLGIATGGLTTPSPTNRATTSDEGATALPSPAAAPAPDPSPIAAETDDLTRAAEELRASAGAAMGYFAEKHSASTGHTIMVLAAALAGVMASLYARAQGSVTSSTLTLALGCGVASLFMYLCRAFTKTNYKIFASVCLRATITLLTVTLRALTLAVERAHLLTVLIVIVCLLVHGVFGAGPTISKHGDGGAYYKFNGISTEAWCAVGPSEAQWSAAVGYTEVGPSEAQWSAAVGHTEARPAVAINTSDSTAPVDADRPLAVGMTLHITNGPTALVDADRPLAVGMTSFTSMPRDATRAEAISTPIEVTMA